MEEGALIILPPAPDPDEPDKTQLTQVWCVANSFYFTSLDEAQKIIAFLNTMSSRVWVGWGSDGRRCIEPLTPDGITAVTAWKDKELMGKWVSEKAAVKEQHAAYQNYLSRTYWLTEVYERLIRLRESIFSACTLFAIYSELNESYDKTLKYFQNHLKNERVWISEEETEKAEEERIILRVISDLFEEATEYI
jgi:hypothetical protein